MQNARFWVFENGDWVKLTLRPEQSLSWFRKGRTEEGWASMGVTWTHTGRHITRDMVEREKDCDGIHGWSSEDYCPLSLLRSVPAYGEEKDERGQTILRPTWAERGKTLCYDQFAERAGY